jgi:zinc-ribbon domain/Immunoglobulin I-set domain
MFCTECGQVMADEAKFCAYCGTRRSIAPVVEAPPPRPEAPSVAPAARTIRSTAEIMPIRMQRPAPLPPVSEVSREEPEHAESVVQWPEEESNAPSMYAPPELPVQRERIPVRPVAPPPPAAETPAAERYVSVPFAASPSLSEVTGERRRVSPVLIGAIIVALIALAGIGWMLRTSMTSTSKAAANVGITIYPTEAKVVGGKSVDFVAEVSGAPGSDVKWSVEEGDTVGEIKTRGASAKGDTISLYSTYTTPKAPGTYHLVATSTADTTKSATAEITVTAK